MEFLAHRSNSTEERIPKVIKRLIFFMHVILTDPWIPVPDSWLCFVFTRALLTSGFSDRNFVCIDYLSHERYMVHGKLEVLRWGVFSPSRRTPDLRTTPCRLSATAYSLYSQRLCISKGRLSFIICTHHQILLGRSNQGE
jgi:hypothetical protein